MLKNRVTIFRRHQGKAPGNFESLIADDELDSHCSYRMLQYDAELFEIRENFEIDMLDSMFSQPGVKWLEVNGINDLNLMRAIQSKFDIHPLIIEDIMNRDVKPKVEVHENFVFIISKLISNEGVTIKVDHFSILLFKDMVISFLSSPNSPFDHLRQRISVKDSRTRRRGPDYLAYVLLDNIVDSFILNSKIIEEEIDILHEEESEDSEEMMKTIASIKKKLIGSRREAQPIQRLSMELKNVETELITEGIDIYLNDLHDHTNYVLDSLDGSREVLMELQQLQLGLMSQKMNDVMRVLTIVATIFIPLTFVAGVYGMNFSYMPELEWEWGYFLILGLMGIMGGVMLYLFHKRGWI